MKYMVIFGMLAVVMIALTIALQPVGQARAREIDLQSQIRAERARAELAQEEARNEQNLAIRRAITPALSTVTGWAVYVLSIAALIAAVAIIGAFAYSTMVVSTSAAHAAVQRMTITSRMIRMDRATRTYGLVFDKKMMYLTNPNTEAVYRIDAPHESNHQAITALAQTQVAGVLSQAMTAQHADAAAAAPLVIDGGGNDKTNDGSRSSG